MDYVVAYILFLLAELLGRNITAEEEAVIEKFLKGRHLPLPSDRLPRIEADSEFFYIEKTRIKISKILSRLVGPAEVEAALCKTGLEFLITRNLTGVYSQTSVKSCLTGSNMDVMKQLGFKVLVAKRKGGVIGRVLLYKDFYLIPYGKNYAVRDLLVKEAEEMGFRSLEAFVKEGGEVIIEVPGELVKKLPHFVDIFSYLHEVEFMGVKEYYLSTRSSSPVPGLESKIVKAYEPEEIA